MHPLFFYLREIGTAYILKWQNMEYYSDIILKIVINMILWRSFMIGHIVKVVVDRPLGSYHPKYKDIYYPINYGYIEGMIAPDGEEQDVYILGVDEPVKEFVGKVIATIHRNDDIEEKLVVAPDGTHFSAEQIMESVKFMEQYFDSEITM